MVLGRHGEQLVKLKGGEPAYRMLVEAMSEGAATLSSDGAVLYSNRKFAEMIHKPRGKSCWDGGSFAACGKRAG